MSPGQISIDGMNAAMAKLERAATRLAAAAAPDGPGGDIVDLSAEMVALLEAKIGFSANVKAAKAFDEVQKSTLSLLG